MNGVVIDLQGVSKYYKLYQTPKDRFKEALNPLGKTYHHKHHVLKGIDLKIRQGEIVGLIGRNGCGEIDAA